MPGGLPLLGHAPRLMRRPFEFLRAVQAVGDVATIKIGRRTAYFVNQPDQLRGLLISDAGKFDKGIHFDKVRGIIGNGLPNSAGAFHRRQRKLIRPAFQRSMLAGYFDIMRSCTLDRITTWPDSGPVDLTTEMHILTVAITAKALFSVDISADLVPEIVRLTEILAVGTGRRVVDPTGLVEKLPIPSNRRFEQAKARIREICEDVVTQRQNNDTERFDVLSMLLAARDDDSGEGMTDRQLRDEVISLMMAGLETTVQATNWTWYALGEYPDVRQRLLAEIDEVLDGRTIEYADLDRMTYCRQVINEVLRVYPPLYFLSRRPTEDILIGGHLIPAGSMVMFSAYALHHDPKLFPDPDRFDPDRWAPGKAEQPAPMSYLPFGAGIRSCVGEQFALIEMVAILGCVLRDWTVRRIDGVEVAPKSTFVLTPSASGVVLEPRGRG